jgi:hypothetical protein
VSIYNVKKIFGGFAPGPPRTEKERREREGREGGKGEGKGKQREGAEQDRNSLPYEEKAKVGAYGQWHNYEQRSSSIKLESSYFIFTVMQCDVNKL